MPSSVEVVVARLKSLPIQLHCPQDRHTRGGLSVACAISVASGTRPGHVGGPVSSRRPNQRGCLVGWLRPGHKLASAAVNHSPVEILS